MSLILIVNGNPHDLMAAGKPDYGQIFEQVFATFDPDLRFRSLNPNHEPLTDAALDGVDGVVFTGSSTEYAATAPEAAPHRAALRQVFDRALPVWGSCNGLQLAAVVLGGSVGASPNGVEIGLGRDLTLTSEGQVHPMMAGRKARFTACTIHRDEVQSLPQGAVVTASNAHSPVQAFAYARDGVDFRGTQYHPEVAPPLIARALRQQQGDAGLAAYLAAYLAADLDRAETDADAAARLGAAPEDLALTVRATELRNWLSHVRAKGRDRTSAA